MWHVFSVAFRGRIAETCSLLICPSLRDYLWDQLILLTLDLFCNTKLLRLLQFFVIRLKYAFSTSYLYSNALRLVDSEFDKLNSLFVFSLTACCDPEGTIKHGVLLICVEKDSILSRFWETIFTLHPALIFS